MVVLVDNPTGKGLLTIDLVKLLPKLKVEILDIQHFMGGAPLLRESTFRRELQEMDLSRFKNTLVGFSNHHDHILPQWAFILLAFSRITIPMRFTVNLIYGADILKLEPFSILEVMASQSHLIPKPGKLDGRAIPFSISMPVSVIRSSCGIYSSHLAFGIAQTRGR